MNPHPVGSLYLGLLLKMAYHKIIFYELRLWSWETAWNPLILRKLPPPVQQFQLLAQRMWKGLWLPSFSQFEHLPPEQWPDRLPDTPTPPPAKVSDGGEPKGVDPNKSPPAPPAPSPNHPSSKSGAMVAPSGLSKRPQPPAELPTPPATGKSAMYADGSYWKPLS